MKKKVISTLFFVAFFITVCLPMPGRQADALADESEKLDRVLENQSKILAKLDEIKSELAVVKVRATER